MPKAFTDIEGVSKDWDGDELRARLRDGGSVLTPNPASLDVSTCVKNFSLLSPILSKMALVENRPVPTIDQLKEEVETLLKLTKQGLNIDFVDISKTAWAIRKLAGFVKMKTRRREVSTATRLQYANAI